jgi:WD40 repeat protein
MSEPSREESGWLRTPVRTLVGHGAPLTKVAPLATGRHLLSTATDGTLRLWDIESGRALSETVLAVQGSTGWVAFFCGF